MPIKCTIGFHSWKPIQNKNGGKPMTRFCKNCKVIQSWDYETARCYGIIVWKTEKKPNSLSPSGHHSGDAEMTYQHIKISAIPAPLGEIIDSSSPTSKAIAKEMALVHAAPDLLAALEAMLAVEKSVTQGQERELSEKAIPLARAAIAKAKGQ